MQPDWYLNVLSNLGVTVLPALALYIAALYLYRLDLHPLAGYPGPKLAAVSNWYEFYYDVIQQGAFTAHIQELHKQYGERSLVAGIVQAQLD